LIGGIGSAIKFLALIPAEKVDPQFDFMYSIQGMDDNITASYFLILISLGLIPRCLRRGSLFNKRPASWCV
jgi:hypothetical protein